MTASVLSLAPRLASTSARAAAPSRARRTGSRTSASSASSSSRSDCTWIAAPLAQKRLGDLREVLHVRAEDDRLAEHRRLEDVVAAVIDEAAADEHDGRHLIELRQLADRVEHDDVGARLGVDRQLGAARGDEAGVAREALDLAEPLGLARREDRQRAAAACALHARTRAARPPPRRASCCRRRSPAGSASMRKNRSTRSRGLPCRRAGAPAASSESNFRLPVTVTRAGSAPRSMRRRADSSLCMQKRSTSASTRRKNGRISR